VNSHTWIRRRLGLALLLIVGVAPLAARAEILVIGSALAQSPALRAKLAAADLTMRPAAPDALVTIDPVATDLVVLASEVPLLSASRLGLSRYLSAAGQVVIVGPTQFDYAPRPADAVALPQAVGDGYRLTVPERKGNARKQELSEPARLENLQTPDGRPALGFRTYLRGMTDFLAEFAAEDARSPRRTVLQFWARGDAFMDLLAIEIRDISGRRWFGFVPLGGQWQRHNISLADFLPEEWADSTKPNPLLQPGEIVTVALGTNMATVWPERPMAFAFGGLELAEDAGGIYAPTSALAALRLPFLESGLSIPDWLFDPFARTEKAAGRTVQIVDPTGAGRKGEAINLPASWLCPVPNVEHPGPRMGTDHRVDYILKFQRESRCVPLWKSIAVDGTQVGNVGELRLAATGPQKGSALALFGVSVTTLLSTPALLDSFAETLIGLSTRTGIAGVTVDLRPAADGSVAPLLQVVVRNPLRHPVLGRLSAEVATGVVRGGVTVLIPARGVVRTQILLSAVPADFPFAQFDWRVNLTTDEGGDELRDTVDVERGLIYALRHLVRTQRTFADGRISHHYFGDAYGVRAMFAYADRLKRHPEHLKENHDLWSTVSPTQIEASGLRFFDMLVVRQNEDGSLPMGYGEHQHVYNVADGGQISLSVGQIEPLLDDPARRESYLLLCRRFADWAETFYIDQKLSADLATKFPDRVKRGETQAGHYGLGWGHLSRNQTGPFWVLPDLLGTQTLLTYVDSNPDYRTIVQRNLRAYLEAGYRSDGYFWAEGLVWAWLSTDDARDRAQIATSLRESFIATLLKGDERDMFDRGARANLNALPLLYYMRYFENTAALRAVLLKYVWAFASENAPNAMRRVSETFPKPAHGESIAAAKQAATGALWAMELLEPGASFPRIDGFPRVPPRK
jgi:hypothetical protein